MPATPFPLQLRALDQDRLRRYREHLAFYEGDQWAGRARRGERRLVLNYARAFVDKITSYLFEGQALQVRPRDPLDRAAADRARAAEQAWRAVEAANGLERLDFETELDCAVLGDAAYKVTWDVAEGRVRISAPDVQGIYVWRAPDDSSRIKAVASQYAAGGTPLATAALPLSPAAVENLVTEHWTAKTFELWRGAELERREANPYGFIPFLVFPNVSEPKQPWGSSDIGPLAEPNRELNRAFSQLSQILELSGNPIAVLEGVVGSQDISVEPGAVWEVPERARAYLLDLLQGGGATLHRDYIDLVYRTLHDLGESPRTAFGQNPSGLSGVALNVELDPVARKVARKPAHPHARLRAPRDAGAAPARSLRGSGHRGAGDGGDVGSGAARRSLPAGGGRALIGRSRHPLPSHRRRTPRRRRPRGGMDARPGGERRAPARLSGALALRATLRRAAAGFLRSTASRSRAA